MKVNNKLLSKYNKKGPRYTSYPPATHFSGNYSDDKINLGQSLRYFGDGFQISKKVDKKRFWRNLTK